MFTVEDVSSPFLAPTAMPIACCHASPPWQTPPEPKAKTNTFFYEWLLDMVLYHSKRKATNT